MWFWRSNKSKRSSSRDLEKYDAYDYDPDDDKRRRRWSQVAVVILVAASIWLADRQGWLPKDPRRAGGRGGKTVVEAPRDGDQADESPGDGGNSTSDAASDTGKSQSDGSAESSDSTSADSDAGATRPASSPSIGPSSPATDDAGAAKPDTTKPDTTKTKSTKSPDGATESDPDSGSTSLDAESTGGKAKASIGKSSGVGVGGKSGGATGGKSVSGTSTAGKSGSSTPITSLIKNVTIRDENDKVVFRGDVDLAETLARIDRGQKLSQYRHDGIEFQNREERLPKKPAGYYHEWVHPTPGLKGPGPQRVVTGKNGDAHYTHDHYQSFRQVR